MKRWQGVRKSNMALVLRITIFSWIFLLEKRHPRFATTKATVSYMPPFIDAFSAPTNLAWRNRSPRQGFRLQATTANEAVTMPSSLPTKNQHSSTVEVWDGVFSETVCGYLHDLAVDHSERTTSEEEEEDNDDEDSDEETLDGSSIFIHRRRRNQVDSSSVAQNPLTPLEQALDSFLAAYYESDDDEDDSSKEFIVEYWCRQEHLNLEAHADVDEVYFEQQQRKGASAEKAFRYPKIGHVLYLTKPSLGRGPTCVFPPTENEPKTGSIADEISSVVTIPAVPGRVLRFPGNALHAVPKAADVWFSKGTETSKDDDEEEDEDDDLEDDWDYEEDDDDDSERSVILFNAWEVTSYNNNETKAIGGPMGVPMDPILQNPTDLELVDMMMSSVDIADSGVQVDEDFVRGMVDYAKRQKQELLEDWRANYSDAPTTTTANVIYSKVHCQAKEHWSMAHVAPSQMISTERGTIRVPLMGDALRRKHPKKTISWIVPSSFQEGVNDSHQPYEFPLSIAEH